MKIEINKSSRIPLYLQIKEQLKELIQNGQLFKGMQLPTERELSHQLKVSRNTVSMAYKELSLEKIISSTSGKGTFITAEAGPENHLLSNTQKSTVIRKIDLAIEKALESNIPVEDFIRLISHRYKEKRALSNNIHIAFIECNQEQLFYFSHKLELGTGINIIPILIDEMYLNKVNFQNQIKSVDLIVTTFFHLQEVEDYLKNENKKIVAIALDPEMETMVRIAHIATPDINIGLVCLTDKFAERVIKSINNSGIKYKNIAFTTTKELNELKRLIRKNDILIVSPGRKKEVQKLISKNIPLIEFIYVPDKGSIDTLNKTIIDIKKKEVTPERNE